MPSVLDRLHVVVLDATTLLKTLAEHDLRPITFSVERDIRTPGTGRTAIVITAGWRTLGPREQAIRHLGFIERGRQQTRLDRSWGGLSE